MEEQKIYQAGGMLDALYQFGPSVAFLPTLLRYYHVLIMTERGEEALAIVDKIYDVLKNQLNVSVGECQRLAKHFSDDKEYLLSILFDIIGNSLLPDLVDDEWILIGILKNLRRLQNCIIQLSEKSSCNEILQSFILPRIRRTVSEVFAAVGGKSKKALTIAEVMCKHAVEIMERYSGDINAAENTLRESLSLMETVLGEEAKKIHLLGTVLNNLGSTCLQLGKLEEAKELLAQAIQVNMDATDYSTEAERRHDVERSSNALEQVDEILRSRDRN